MRASKPVTEPPRPLCMCGSPGMFRVQIDVQELVLDREAGLHARPHWVAKYNMGTRVEAIVCQVCARANVKLQVSASASIEQARGVP